MCTPVIVSAAFNCLMSEVLSSLSPLLLHLFLLLVLHNPIFTHTYIQHSTMKALVHSALQSTTHLPILAARVKVPVKPIEMSSVLQRSRRIIATDSIDSKPLLYKSANELHEDLVHRSAWAVGFLSAINFEKSSHKSRAQMSPPQSGTLDYFSVDPSLRDSLCTLLDIFMHWFISACELPLVVDDATHKEFLVKLAELQKPAGQELLSEIIRIGRASSASPQLHFVLETICRLRVYWQLLTANHRAGVHRTGAGVFRDDIRLSSIAKNVLEGVVAQTTTTYSCCPDINISGDEDSTTCLTHAEPNLSYIFAELMKNASRATVEEHHRKGLPNATLPPVEVNIRSLEDGNVVEAEFSDCGAGIHKNEIDRVWQFGYTTNAKKHHKAATKADTPIVAGFGLGLPMSRMYAEQFGGSLTFGRTDRGCSVVFRHSREGAEGLCPVYPPTFD